MQDLTVALIQSAQFWEDKQSNFELFEMHFKKSLLGKEIDLVLLPEMFNTGFSMQVQEMGETIDGISVNWLRKWAKELNTTIGASLIIHENGNYYNRFVLVTENGIQASYNKRHLFRMANENESFTAGSERVIYQLKGWNLMLQVCYDLRFPVFSRNKTIVGKKEYDVLLYIANWPEKRAYVWKNLIQARAIENQTYCLGVNRVGTDGKSITYSGDSMVVDPWGKITHQATPHSEEIIVQQLKKSVLDEIEISFPAFLDAD